MNVEAEMTEKREYELAVLAMEEGYETPMAQDIEVVQKDGPKSVPLAYPIKKHLSAYMRVYIVRALPQAAAELNKSVEADQSVLRHILITPPIAVRRREVPAGEREAKAEAVRPTSPEAVSNAALEAALGAMLDTNESQ